MQRSVSPSETCDNGDWKCYENLSSQVTGKTKRCDSTPRLNDVFNLRQLHWQQFWGSAPYIHWTSQGITSPCNRSRLEFQLFPPGSFFEG